MKKQTPLHVSPYISVIRPDFSEICMTLFEQVARDVKSISQSAEICRGHKIEIRCTHARTNFHHHNAIS